MHRIVVVLPAPFGPRKPVTMPGSMLNVSPSTAVFSPYRFVRPCSSIIKIVLSPVTWGFIWPSAGRVAVCTQLALRQTSLACDVSKMILAPRKFDAHPRERRAGDDDEAL